MTVAKVAILDDGGSILLLRRSLDSKYRPGKWDFPGGEINAKDDILTGTAREVGLEAGLKLKATDLAVVYAATAVHQGLSATQLLLVAHIAGQPSVSLSDEHQDFRWTTIEVALDVLGQSFYPQALAYAADHDLL